jgi:hypothetical protein
MLWLGKYSLSSPRIESKLEVYWHDMILDSRDDYLRLARMWRMQFRKEDQIFMIRVVQ